jgi:hypothetical protein
LFVLQHFGAVKAAPFQPQFYSRILYKLEERAGAIHRWSQPLDPVGTAIQRRAPSLSGWRASGLSACFFSFGLD